MKRSLVLIAALAACGPPLPKSSDGGAEGGTDGGSDASTPEAPTTTCTNPIAAPACANPAAKGCTLLDRSVTSNWCSDSAFNAPTSSGTCFVPLTTGIVSFTAGADAPSSTANVGARRVKGCLVEIVGLDPKSAIRIVVPAAVGTFACGPDTGAWVRFANVDGTTITGYEGQGSCSINVTAFGDSITGSFSVDGSLPITNASFSVSLAQ